VELSPQSKFNNIENIRRAQIAAGDVENSSSKSSGFNIPSKAKDYIIVVANNSEGDNNDNK
jgi:hypothetical protein